MTGFIIFLFSILVAITPKSSAPVHAVSKPAVKSAVITVAPTRIPTPTNTPKSTPTPKLWIPTVTPTPKIIMWPTYTPIPTPTTYIYQAPTTTNTDNLSNNNYYTNSAGNDVHAPAYTTDNSVPAGATAKCSDGTYSFSQSRSGTCSHHGGVVEWL